MIFKQELHRIFLAISVIISSFSLNYFLLYFDTLSKINNILGIIIFIILLLLFTKVLVFVIYGHFCRIFLPKNYKSNDYLDVNKDFDLQSSSIITYFTINLILTQYDLNYLILISLVIIIFLIIHYINNNFEPFN